MPETPAEELRAAAAKLRERAAAALVEIHANPYWDDDPANFAEGINNACGGAGGELAAMFSPEAAERLAVLLDDLAEFTSLVESEPPPGHVAGKALALARVINGGTS